MSNDQNIVISDGVGERGRSMSLDVLRGIAILLVLFRHPAVLPGAAGHLGRFIAWTEHFGWTGVDLFFVLSGFLIGGLLFAEIRDDGKLHVRRFLIRRAFKIWPGYFVFLAYAIGFSIHTQHGFAAGIRPLLPNLIHLQNYFGTPEQHTWSLAVEEHFYLVLPVVLVLLIRAKRLSWLPILILAICVGCLILRLTNPAELSTDPVQVSVFTHLTPTHLRIDSLAFGVLLAYLAQFRTPLFAAVGKHQLLLLALGGAFLAPLFVVPSLGWFAWTVGFTLAYLGYGCILIVCVEAKHGVLARLLSGRTARVLAFIGFYSYSIYLWHLVAVRIVIRFEVSPHGLIRWLVRMPISFALSILFGIVAAKLIEQPFLRYRDRHFPARKRVILTSAQSVPTTAERQRAVQAAELT